MNISKYRITANGRLAGVIFVEAVADGKTASILPIRIVGEFSKDTMEAQANRLFHQHFSATASDADIHKQLLAAAGIAPADVLVTRAPW